MKEFNPLRKNFMKIFSRKGFYKGIIASKKGYYKEIFTIKRINKNVNVNSINNEEDIKLLIND